MKMIYNGINQNKEVVKNKLFNKRTHKDYKFLILIFIIFTLFTENVFSQSNDNYCISCSGRGTVSCRYPYSKGHYHDSNCRKCLSCGGTGQRLGYLYSSSSSSSTRDEPELNLSVTGQLIPSTGIVPDGFVRINGGTFIMGSPENETGRVNDEGQRQVTLSSFNMSKYEVTQKEWQEIMGTTVRQMGTTVRQQSNKRDSSLSMYGEGDNHPIYFVSWYDAIEYCNKKSQKEGLTPAYTINGTNVTWNRSANGYRLPTEAEWEYACRAGTTTPFSTGNNITTSQANYNGNYPHNNNAKGEYRKETTPVGTFAANAYGLYDMHGNVLEWCWDRKGNNYPSEAQIDPVGSSSGVFRVCRGNSWNGTGTDNRSARRHAESPSNRFSNLGFRLVRP